MKIRTILLAGSVLPFALSTPGLALEQNAAPFILAQAESCAADDADCLAREKKREERAQRRKEQKEEAEQSETPAEEAPAAEPPAAEADPEPEPEQAPAARTAPAEAPATDAPAEAEAEEPAPRKERRKAAEEAPAADSPAETAPSQAVVPESPAPATETQTTTESAPDGAEPAAAEELTPRELRRRERERRRLEAAGEAEQPATTAPAVVPVPAPSAPASTDAAAPVTAPVIAEPAATVVEPGEAEPTSREERQRARAERRKLREAQEAAQPPAATAPAGATATSESTIELQLESQGNDEQAEQIRGLRRKLEAERSDGGRDRGSRRREGETVERRGDRDIIRFGTQIIIRPTENVENERLLYGASDVEVRELSNGYTETIVYRENGSQIITVRNEYGEIVSRVRRTRNGREVVLIDNSYPEGQPPEIVYFERELPPLVVDVPREEYIVETRRASEEQIVEAFAAAPVERVERAYTLEEIRRSERLRDKVRRVDLDTITFETGSAVIQSDQLDALDQVGVAIEEVLAKNPEEVFLIEGHTDAVGSDESNLLLSDRRAEAVAVALAQDFSIPPENLVTQGYGEEFLKVPTEGAERANRRVTMRNISDLMTASK